MSFDIKDYPTFLSEIKKRPQMWCGGQERSATLLSTFLNGFRYSEHFHKIPESERLDGFDWEQFEKWVQKNYNPKGLSYDSFSWAVFQAKEEKKHSISGSVGTKYTYNNLEASSNNARQSDGFSVPCFAVKRYATAKQSTAKPQLLAA